jgi:hypothetical protein
MRADCSTVAKEVHDLKCPKCGAKWRYIVHPNVLPDETVIHAVVNEHLICLQESEV